MLVAGIGSGSGSVARRSGSAGRPGRSRRITEELRLRDVEQRRERLLEQIDLRDRGLLRDVEPEIEVGASIARRGRSRASDGRLGAALGPRAAGTGKASTRAGRVGEHLVEIGDGAGAGRGFARSSRWLVADDLDRRTRAAVGIEGRIEVEGRAAGAGRARAGRRSRGRPTLRVASGSRAPPRTSGPARAAIAHGGIFDRRRRRSGPRTSRGLRRSGSAARSSRGSGVPISPRRPERSSSRPSDRSIRDRGRHVEVVLARGIRRHVPPGSAEPQPARAHGSSRQRSRLGLFEEALGVGSGRGADVADGAAAGPRSSSRSSRARPGPGPRRAS